MKPVRAFEAPRIQKPDPPDCVCVNAAGESVAVEVAEVVSEEAARLTAQGNSVARVWRPGELIAYVDQLLADKDRKTYHGGPYAGIAVALFTDEPMLTLQEATSELNSASFGPYSQITSAYLLLSYDPYAKSCPVIALAVRR